MYKKIPPVIIVITDWGTLLICIKIPPVTIVITDWGTIYVHMVNTKPYHIWCIYIYTKLTIMTVVTVIIDNLVYMYI